MSSSSVSVCTAVGDVCSVRGRDSSKSRRGWPSAKENEEEDEKSERMVWTKERA